VTAPVRARPASDFDPLALLQVVREVAEQADADEPENVSTRAWDDARARTNDHADAPAARRICEFVGLPWPKVRELAFMPPRGRRIGLGHALNEKEGGWLTPEYSDFVLRLIARRLRRDTLTPGQYRRERTAMLRAHGSRTTHGGQLRLPTEEQVSAVAGSWDQALTHAGLRGRQGLGGQRAAVGPAAIVDVLDRCFEHHRAEPTARELETFARANGIPFPRRERGRPWSDYVREWKDRRRAAGLPVPDGPPPTRTRPDYSQDVGAARPGERRGRKAWDDPDEVVDWVVRYLQERPPRENPTQRRYDEWAAQTEGAPWSSNIDRHGGWEAVLRAAQRRLRAAA
jgi:hypothetical protein